MIWGQSLGPGEPLGTGGVARLKLAAARARAVAGTLFLTVVDRALEGGHRCCRIVKGSLQRVRRAWAWPRRARSDVDPPTQWPHRRCLRPGKATIHECREYSGAERRSPRRHDEGEGLCGGLPEVRLDAPLTQPGAEPLPPAVAQPAHLRPDRGSPPRVRRHGARSWRSVSAAARSRSSSVSTASSSQMPG